MLVRIRGSLEGVACETVMRGCLFLFFLKIKTGEMFVFMSTFLVCGPRGEGQLLLLLCLDIYFDKFYYYNILVNLNVLDRKSMQKLNAVKCDRIRAGSGGV